MKTVHAHGMLVGCALSYAVYRSVTFELIDSWIPFAQLYATIMGSAVGVMLAGGPTLARRRWQGDVTMASQPGRLRGIRSEWRFLSLQVPACIPLACKSNELIRI